jgi:hypothetical protein
MGWIQEQQLMHIVMDLTTRHGGDAYGPFDSDDDAQEWIYDKLLDDCYYIVEVKDPESMTEDD